MEQGTKGIARGLAITGTAVSLLLGSVTVAFATTTQGNDQGADSQGNGTVGTTKAGNQDDQGIATATSERWSAQFGVYRRTSELTTRNVVVNGVSVVAVDSDTASPGTTNVTESPDGTVQISASSAISEEQSVATFASSGSGWSIAGSDCAARYNVSGGYTDACYQIWKATSTSDPSYDYWTFKEYATAQGTGVSKLKTAWVSSSRNSASTGSWYWVEWSPTSDMNVGNCRTETIGISAVAELSMSYQLCDQQTIEKSATAGTFKTTWSGSVNHANRSVAAMTVVKTPKGKSMVWNWSYGLSTSIL